MEHSDVPLEEAALQAASLAYQRSLIEGIGLLHPIALELAREHQQSDVETNGPSPSIPLNPHTPVPILSTLS